MSEEGPVQPSIVVPYSSDPSEQHPPVQLVQSPIAGPSLPPPSRVSPTATATAISPATTHASKNHSNSNTPAYLANSTTKYQPPHTTMDTMNTAAAATTSAPPLLESPDHHHDDHSASDDDKPSSGGGKGPTGKSRRELPAGAVTILKAWLLSPEHFTHPYPTPQDQILLMQKTGIDKKQLKNWFTNARRRIWKPMLKKQLEAGKLAAAGGVTVNVGVGVNGMMGGGGQHLHQQPQQGMGVPMPNLSMSDGQQQPHSQQQQGMIVPGMAMVGQGPMGVDMSQMGGGVAPGQYPQQEMVQQQGQQVHEAMYTNFHQAQMQMQQSLQPPQQVSSYDYNNQMYQQHQQPQQQSYYQPQQLQQPTENQSMPASQHSHSNSNAINASNSIGSLPPMNHTDPSNNFNNGNNNNSNNNSNQFQMIKTDSHAVLMELFARDQDLVRQATAKGHGDGGDVHSSAMGPASSATASAGAMLQPSGPSGILRNYPSSSMGGATAAAAADGAASSSMMGGGGGGMGHKQNSVTFDRIPNLSSWPHFSSVSSLNNLGGTLAGVKSITNLSAADLSSQGNLNKMGNLAQVKSFENMGRGDSYAFLEVFFDDRSGLASGMNGSCSGLSIGGGSTNGQRGVKREREDDDAIGLSLDGDDSAPVTDNSKQCSDQQSGEAPQESAPAPLADDSKNENSNGGKLKRAYDDALAARGLIAVRMSSEKLTDLALPAKMQRTLSQEYIRQHQQGQSLGNFFSSSSSPFAPQQTQQHNLQTQSSNAPSSSRCETSSAPVPDKSTTSTSVEVPSTTICAICGCINVDTQLRPCGHMFHGRCLKPSLQNAVGPPKCPIDGTPMQSAVLAVPTAPPEDSGSAITV